jgi:hypothetical protein
MPHAGGNIKMLGPAFSCLLHGWEPPWHYTSIPPCPSTSIPSLLCFLVCV